VTERAKIKRQKSKSKNTSAGPLSFLPFAFCLLICAGFQALAAQALSWKGFLDSRLTLFPQDAPNDRAHAWGAWRLRVEPTWKPRPWLKFDASLDARADTHRQYERSWRLDGEDRRLRGPAFSVRRLSATVHRGQWTAEFGRQFIRWGKADILNPTDRFAPRDYLAVVDNDFLAVTAARLTWESGPDTVDLVYAPRFTPSRTPLLNQRWTVLPPEAAGIAIVDRGAVYPGGGQYGIRWNHLGGGYEYSLSYYDGFHHLPLIDARLTLGPARAELTRFYPKRRVTGLDIAVPLRWFTAKGEAAYLKSPHPLADEFFQYVVQVERLIGEWSLVGGYAGEALTERRSLLEFSPDRGFTKAFLGRAGYTIDANRSLAVELAARQNGAGSWARFEYSQALGQHWRATGGFTWIRGRADDFLGQYRRNSHFTLVLRYSF
jgi:hypothetical protein